MTPIFLLAQEITRNSLRIRGVAVREGLEEARQEFDSTINALDEALQIAIKASPPEAQLIGLLEEYFSTMEHELQFE